MASAEARMVGRHAELASLERLLAAQDGGRPQFVAVSGEPGIGKTRLLAELVSRAAERDRLVLEGRATEFEREVPFAPLVDALDDYVGSLHPRRLETLGNERLAELARAFPSLAEFGDERVALEAERYRLHRATRALLELLAAHPPLVLVLDDVHWVDAGSLELLRHLLRHPPAGPVLIALAYRPAQVDHALAAHFASGQAGDAMVIELGALTRAETDRLLEGELAPEDLAVVFEESGGNPFFALQIARAPTSKSRTVGGAAAELGDVPGAVVAAMERELADLAPGVRLLLEGAAVAGDPFDLSLACAAAEADEEQARPMLDALVRADLARAGEAPSLFRFRHPVVRRAVYAASAAGWRLGAHARAARELERRGAPARLRAHHVERSARPGDEAAIAVLSEAAATASPRAPATAARWYEAALELTPVDATRHRLGLQLALAGALAAAGSLSEAGERVAEALELVQPEQGQRYVQLIALAAGIDHLLGRHDEAHARLVSALASLPEDESPGRAALQIQLALHPAYAGATSPETDRASRAITDLNAIPEPELRAGAAATLAVSTAMAGDTAEARRLARAAAETIDAFDEARIATCLEAAFTLGSSEWWVGDYEQSERHLGRALAISRANGQGRFLVPLLTNLAIAQANRGRIPKARTNTEDAVDAARLAGTPGLLIWALTDRCLIETEYYGDVRSAFPLGEELRALVEAVGLTHHGAAGIIYQAGMCLERGDPDRCLALLRDAETQRAGLGLFLRFMAEERRARALLALGRRDDAAEVVEQLEALAATADVGLQGSAPRRARATLLLADGRPGEAAEMGLAAVADAGGSPVEEARCRILAGRALAAAGDRKRAVGELERAHRELEACGAIGFRDEAARELRQLGRRVARKGTARARGEGVGALSGRELEVAELVAAGNTNKQIAASLFVSESTVEKHLAKVFEKLGVSRRGAVASRLAESSG